MESRWNDVDRVDDVRVEEQPYQGLGIVRVRLDVAQHDHAVVPGRLSGGGGAGRQTGQGQREPENHCAWSHRF